jgi:hypothetical protein
VFGNKNCWNGEMLCNGAKLLHQSAIDTTGQQADSPSEDIFEHRTGKIWGLISSFLLIKKT